MQDYRARLSCHQTMGRMDPLRTMVRLAPLRQRPEDGKNSRTGGTGVTEGPGAAVRVAVADAGTMALADADAVGEAGVSAEVGDAVATVPAVGVLDGPAAGGPTRRAFA